MKISKWLKHLVGPVSLFMLPVAAWHVATTNAYLSDYDDEINRFTTSPVTTEIVEIFPEPELGKATKVVQIKNTGEQNCYVRCLIVASDDTMDVEFENSEYKQFWELHEDGYYYYKAILESGETTEPVLSSVTFTPQAGEDYSELK